MNSIDYIDGVEALSFDQLRVFAAVARVGSFSAAAREMKRVQSAVTYAIQKLEDQIGTALFDRSGYRPILTPEGAALLPRARRILEELDALKVQARGLAGGIEPELSIVIDAMVELEPIVSILSELRGRFPSVTTRLQVETLGKVAESVMSGEASVGVALTFVSAFDEIVRRPVGSVQLVIVAAPGHPLARLPAPLPQEQLREHVQLVLTDRSDLTADRDYGVSSTMAWRTADLGAKLAMLRAGVGWGSMPLHMVEGDLVSGRLVELQPAIWDGEASPPRLSTVLIHRRDAAPGMAGRWLMERLESAPEVRPG